MTSHSRKYLHGQNTLRCFDQLLTPLLICNRYPARPTVQVLDCLSLTVQPGAFNAIVGTSGGGKSTLVSLLLRIYDYSGQVLIGSQELRALSKSDIRSQTAVLDQDCVLFSGTIFENICHGVAGQNIPESMLESMCERAAISAGIDFLDALPNGIHTRIGSTLHLSGGQCQRVCLARALIKNPAILLLDEPTSALDAWSELKVMQVVREAVSSGTTVLMIAHRLSTVTGADHIAVVSDGRVVEQGAPTQLSKEGTIFRGLLDAQNTTLAPDRPALSSPGNSSHDSGVSKGCADGEDLTAVGSEFKPSLKQVAGAFVSLTRPGHPYILAGLLSATVSGSVIIGEAIIFGNLVQLLNEGQHSVHFQQQARFLCLMFFVCACVALLSYVCSGVAFGIASTRLTSRVQRLLLRNVLQLDISWFSGMGRSAQELTSSFAKDSADLACLSGVALGTIFTVITSVFGGIVLAHTVAWKIAVV